MLRINREVEYAVITLKALSEEERVFSSRELAERFGIPCELLRKVLQRLAQGGLAGVQQGKKGGYFGVRTLDGISIGEVADAVLERNGVVQCLEDEGGCPQEDLCTIRENMSSFQGLWNGFLHTISIRDFTENRHREWNLSLSQEADTESARN